MIKVINEAEFSEVLEKDVAFVDFFATWCGPCKMLGPVLENISDNVDGASFFKIDVDDAEEIAAKYGIMSIPAVFAFKKGEVVAKNVGYNGPEALEKFVKDNL
ncbi:MAG: thioredoxin [Lachnospiraceae bacterium]|nr:thioredoxin [Lachnospiraceae bacterium]